jgi:L-fuconolactonase
VAETGQPRRIDAHQHFWQVARGDYHWMTPDLRPLYRDFGPEDLRPHLTRNGIDAVVTVQAAETVAETEYLLEIAAATDFVAGVVGWAPFDRPEGPDVVARLAESPWLKGLRPMIQDIADDDWMLGEALAPTFAAVQALDLAFDALVFPRHLKNLMRLIDRYPGLRLIVDHGAKPQIRDRAFDGWAADIATVARDSPALVKLSGLVTEAGETWTIDDLRPYVDHLLEVFGPERIVFGSDWPVVRLAADYDPWFNTARDLTAGLPERGRQMVFGDNAVRFYRL